MAAASLDDAENKQAEDADPIVVLNVSGERMETRRSTLTLRSEYFRAQLSGRYKDWDPKQNAPIFVDADPKIFCEILNCLRCADYVPTTQVLPFFDFFGIDRPPEPPASAAALTA